MLASAEKVPRSASLADGGAEMISSALDFACPAACALVTSWLGYLNLSHMELIQPVLPDEGYSQRTAQEMLACVQRSSSLLLSKEAVDFL